MVWLNIKVLYVPLLSFHRSTHSVKHFKVDIHKRMIVFGQEKFSNVEEFIEHFDNRPLIGDDTGILYVTTSTT